MDWDGVGTFALFLSTGAIGLGLIALRGYKAWLASKIEVARLRYTSESGGDADERLAELEDKVERLSERVDFSEKMLGAGEIASKASE